jgi:hypothetical protein
MAHGARLRGGSGAAPVRIRAAHGRRRRRSIRPCSMWWWFPDSVSTRPAGGSGGDAVTTTSCWPCPTGCGEDRYDPRASARGGGPDGTTRRVHDPPRHRARECDPSQVGPDRRLDRVGPDGVPSGVGWNRSAENTPGVDRNRGAVRVALVHLDGAVAAGHLVGDGIEASAAAGDHVAERTLEPGDRGRDRPPPTAPPDGARPPIWTR